MTQHTLLRFASLIIFTLAFTSLVYAVAPQRTFVSAQTGNDANTANNCSLTQPCRNFNAAIGVVNAGGEVVALDSGGYGATTISKAVTLTSPLGSLCCYYRADRRQQRDYSQRGEHRHCGLARADVDRIRRREWHQRHVGGQSARRGVRHQRVHW